jgi:uncharacterized membrane protein
MSDMQFHTILVAIYAVGIAFVSRGWQLACIGLPLLWNLIMLVFVSMQ